MVDDELFLQTDPLAAEILELLQRQKATLVLAESCTCGLIAATLARIPGMSAVLAGSFVVYQIDSKAAWLNISRELIDRCDVVSSEVAAAMAEGALVQTPHASIALSITGHLGPGAPADLDGIAWLGMSERADSKRAIGVQSDRATNQVSTFTKLLNLVASSARSPLQIRRERQARAAILALETLRLALRDACDGCDEVDQR